MSRRVATTVAFAALLAGAALPLAGHAAALPCPSWTDVAGDAAPQTGNPAAAPTPFNDNFDIVSFGVGSSGSDVTAFIQVTKLATQFTGAGDEFTVAFTADNKLLTFTGARDAVGTRGSISRDTGESGEAVVTYDPATNTVRFVATMAEFEKAAGTGIAGKSATAWVARAGEKVQGRAISNFDRAEAPAGDSYVLGTVCGGGAPVELPVGYPKVGCFTVGDGTNDARPFNQTPYDPDLDLTGVVLQATDENVKAFVSVVALGTKPANFYGHGFHVTFTAGADQAVELVADAYDPALVGTVAALHAPTTAVLVNSVAVPDSGLTVSWDPDHDVVVLTVPRAKMNAAVPGFADGSEIKLLTALSEVATGGSDQVVDTTATGNVAQGDAKWTVGDNACFEVPKGKLSNAGVTSVAFSDAGAFATKLTDSTGKALAGRTLTFTIGGRSQTVTTGTDGVARKTFDPGLAAGTYTLTTSFAGDSAAGAVDLATPVKVVVEKTKLALTVTSSGTKRTVVAKLTDDDAKLLAGQTVVWFVNGKQVAAPKTTSKGTVTLTTAKPGQTVLAQYAGLAGKYAGSKASRKV